MLEFFKNHCKMQLKSGIKESVFPIFFQNNKFSKNETSKEK